MKVLRAYPHRELTFGDIMRLGLPSFACDRHVNLWRLKNMLHLWRGFWKISIARLFKIPHFYGQLFLTKITASGDHVQYGLASLRVVVDNGAGFIVDAWQNIVELEIMKYHGVGTGTNAEAATDTALQTECTTALNPDNTRATGSTTEASQKVFRTVGTNTFDASAAVTEHGILSQAATGGGTLLDRSVFSAINVVSGDSIQSTYDFTINSGS